MSGNNLHTRQRRGGTFDEDLDRVTERLKLAINMMGITQSCLNCNHFNEAIEGCGANQNRRPPARIIAFGCDNHSSEIPF